MVIRNTFLIITGMHRSGTSFLARALNLAGVNLGTFESLTSNEWKFFPDNIRGHWENKKILDLTNQTLSKNKGSWDNPPEKIVINKKIGKEILKETKDLMENNSLASGFKDPRIIPCLESWLKYLPKNIIIVGIFRHPLKVAESLKMRDGFSYEKSLKLWKIYNEKLLLLLEKYNGFLIDFDLPKKKLISDLNYIIKKIGLDQKVELSEWYSKEILKADKTYQSDYTLTKDIKRLYSKLKKRSQNNKKVKVKKIARTSKKLESVIHGLLLEKQAQGRYFRSINQENLNLIKNIQKKPEPISALISIYSKRPDLRDAFPEVVNGDYNRLVKWGISVVQGQIKDEESINKLLSKFLPDYKEYLKSKQLAQSYLVKEIEKTDVLKEKLKAQQKSFYENEEARKKLDLLNQENVRRIGELEKVREENIRKIGELEGLNQENVRRNSELEKVREENTRKIGELEGLNQENVRRNSELEKVREENTRKIGNYLEESIDQTNKIKFLDLENQKYQEKISNLRNELDTLQNSIPYKISRDITTYIDDKIPPNTKRGKFLRRIIFNKYKKALAGKTQLTAPTFSYEYYFDDTVDKEALSILNSTLKIKPKISIIMPVYNPEISFLKKAIQSVKNQYYTNWQLCICDDGSTKEGIHNTLRDESANDDRISLTFSEKNEGISAASNKAIKLANGEFTLLLDNDDEIAKNALLEVVKTINENTDVDFIYSDEDKIDEKDNHSQPFFKPDWSPDLFFSYNFPIHVSVFRTFILKQIGGFRIGFEGAQDYDLILRYLEKTHNISHIPKVLYSWRTIPGSTALGPFEKDYAYAAGTKAINDALKRRKLNAHCEGGIQMGTYRVKYGIQDDPTVSIIIPTNSLENLQVCLRSILKKCTYRRFEIIVMDSSKDNKIENFCKEFEQVKYQKVSLEKFNFSKVNNDGVNKSIGHYVIFLNDDTQVINPDWIENLLEHAQRKEVGIVGAKLLYKDDHVQHAGTIVGIQRHAGNYGGMHKNDGGYFSFAKVIRNCSAVTAACMMMRKEIFNQIGGFDEKMAQSWQDVDFCIRTKKTGKLILYTPYSVLYHYEGQTRGSMDTSDEELEARRIFRKKHEDFIKNGDPYYNPNLSLAIPYRIVKNYPKPLRDLVDLYEKRSDLRKNFPNEQEHGFRNLIDWAATHGVVMDSEKEVLQPHFEYYFEKCSQNAKPLAKKIQLFLKDQKLQKKFPEVFNGNLEHFLKHTQKKL